MRSGFLKLGFTEASPDEPCDFVVVNTCTVTGAADRKCRQMIRKVLSHNPKARVAVMGCLVENPDFINDFPGRVEVFTREQKPDILKLLGLASAPGEGVFPQKRARALLKIQDGCDHFCSYCIVPYVRGRSRSREKAEIRREVEKLAQTGYRELVLCGVHLGAWGRDFKPQTRLVDLIEELLRDFPGLRFRLSSLEPMDFSPELPDLMKRYPNCCPHLHLPLQHSSPKILNLMNRRYDPQELKSFWLESRKSIPGLALTMDIMVGFPGESDDDFAELRRYLSDLPFYHLHIFAYSPRPGTRAAAFPGKVGAETKKARSRELQELNREAELRFLEENVGRHLQVLPESSSSGGRLKGHSENYLPVEFQGPVNLRGQLLRVKITGMDGVKLVLQGEIQA